MLNLKTLDTQSRLLFEVALRPVQGHRFQPTGFPDLGAAAYTLPGGTEMLVVESPQSMANRLEATAWDQAADDLVPSLRGLPYIVAVSDQGKTLTSSILEAHRLNSPYFLDSDGGRFFARLKSELDSGQGDDPEAVDLRRAASVVFKYDPNSLLHGLFLASKKLAGGRYRFVRLLSAFVEAEDVLPAESGGVKNDRVNPSGNTKTGYGNVPFHRTEFVASAIKAYFSFDLVTLRGYGLGEAPVNLLTVLGLWKIRMLLDGTLRFRTACDLSLEKAGPIFAKTPDSFELPSAEELSSELCRLIGVCSDSFAKPPVTRVTWSAKEAKQLAAERIKKETEDEEASQ